MIGSQPMYKNMRENTGKHRPISLASVLGKVMEIIILGDIKSQLKNKAIIRHIQNKSIKRKSCIRNFISFYSKVTHLMYKRKAVHVIFQFLVRPFIPFLTVPFWTNKQTEWIHVMLDNELAERQSLRAVIKETVSD